jgi:formylglycine-generating enzyme required for sulfatase activity
LPEFELVRLLGRGGFGEVWQAVGSAGFPLALKFVRLGERASAVELRALGLMKDVRHPHLLGVHGAWQREDYLIVAMDLADRTLMDRLNEARERGLPGIPRDELLDYLGESAKGLDFLNVEKKIQHRDVKPQNLLLVGGGVKVADFGLAKVLERTVMSHTGAMTPAYAAPEFHKGEASAHSDQYSLAITFCVLRSGRFPFEGNLMQLMYARLHGEPDLSMLPEAERPAVARALAKEPEQRWPSCREFVAALGGNGVAAPALPRTGTMPETAPPSVPAGPPPRSRRRRLVLAGLLALLALALPALLIWALAHWLGGPEKVQTTEPGPVTLVKDKADDKGPQPAALALLPIADLTLKAGEAGALTVRIRRQNCTGAIRLTVEGLPDGVDTTAVEVPAGEDEARVRLMARDDAEDSARDVRVVATLGDLLEGQKVRVAVRAKPRLLVRKIADVTLEAGRTVEVTVRVERRHCPGPIELKLEGLPAGVRPSAARIEAGADTGRVVLTAAADAADVAGKTVRVRVVAADAAGDGTFGLTVRRLVLAKEVEFYGGLRLVLIKPGKFQMGSSDAERERFYGKDKDFVKDEAPQHEVEITRPFYVAVYPVTQEQYGKLTGLKNPSWFSEDGGGKDKVKGLDTRRFSVEQVSWKDARAFIDALNKADTKKPAGWEYDLPTEAEWEYACRAAPTPAPTTAYSFGNDPKDLGEYAWYGGNADGRPHEVGTRKPNPWGLHDMHGNVWQWCRDGKREYDKESKKDPKGSEKLDARRVVRGGTWNGLSGDCRSARRSGEAPGIRGYDVGFRVVLRPAPRDP